MKTITKSAAVLLGALGSALVLAGSAGAHGVTNGSFESGSFAGWTVVNQVGGSGDWFAYSGTVAPLSGYTIAAPPDGVFAATSDQTGPGSHVLYQNIPAVVGAVLTFDLYYANQNFTFFTPDSLDYTVVPNQQYRVDLMRLGSPVFSVAPADVVANLFRTEVGDAPFLGPTQIEVPLTQFTGGTCGRTLRLRFAEVDNAFFFQGSVDNVHIHLTKPLPMVPCRLLP